MPKLQKPQVILIDVDGTMVDSVPDLSWCLDETLIRLNMPKRGIKKARTWVGNGVAKLVHRGLMDDLDSEADLPIFNKAIEIFKELYAKNTSKKSQVFAGVNKTLEFLQKEGYKLACVTNKSEQFTLPLLKDLGLFNFFAIIVSGDTLPKKKPDPMPLVHIADFF